MMMRTRMRTKCQSWKPLESMGLLCQQADLGDFFDIYEHAPRHM